MIDEFEKLINLFSIILFLTTAIVIFKYKKLEATLLITGIIVKNTPSLVVLYLLIPNNLYMSWKFKVVNLLTPLGSALMAIAVLMLVWKLMKFEEAKKV